MRILEVFFDYACPYCYSAYPYFVKLLPQHKDIQVKWRPVEAHPRPEKRARYSNLCAAGMYYAECQGIDLTAYHDAIFKAVHKQGIDIEDTAALADAVKGILDVQTFTFALKDPVYLEQVTQANDEAYTQRGVWAVPACRLDGKCLDAVESIGITEQQLAEFLR